MNYVEDASCEFCGDDLCPGCEVPVSAHKRTFLLTGLVAGFLLIAGFWFLRPVFFSESSQSDSSNSTAMPRESTAPTASSLTVTTTATEVSISRAPIQGDGSLDQPLNHPLLANRPAVLWFWDPFCEGCGRDASFLMSSVTQWSGIINFISVPIGGGSQERDEFVKSHGISIPEIDGTDGKLVSQFGTDVLPRWGMIARDGATQTFAAGIGYPELEREFIALSRSLQIAVIDTLSESEVRAAFNREFGSNTPPLEWTGAVQGCQPGTTSPAHQHATVARINWYRAMAGVDPWVTLNSDLSVLAQAAALTMFASGRLDHEPDASFRCMTQWSYEGASRSNLHLGTRGPAAIDGYIEDEGANNAEVGHRRWILLPELMEVGTGDTKGSNALLVIGGKEGEAKKVRDRGLVMWPPRGFVPRSTIYRRWSISAERAFNGGAYVFARSKNRVLFDDYVFPDSSVGWPTLVFSIAPSSLGSGPIDVDVFGLEGYSKGDLIFSYQVIPID